MIFRKRFKTVSLVLLGILASLAALPVIRACGPDGPSLAFSWENHPDLPLNDFAAGRLGILQPTYARTYLVVAYRYLTGAPLSRAERDGVLSLWNGRLQGGVQLPRPAKVQAADESRAPLAWTAARARFTRDPAPELNRFRWNDNAFLPVISDSALEVASATLLDRAGRWRPEWVAEWIKAQDQVFTAAGAAQFASGVPAGHDALFRQDRAYQVASARFYSGDFQAARAAFTAISPDPLNPWRRLAAYLVGRCWLMEGAAAAQGAQASCYREALQVFTALRTRGLPQRPAGGGPEPVPETDLLQAVQVAEFKAWTRADPAAAGARLVGQLLGRDACPDFGDALGRYSYLLDANIRGENGWAADREQPRSILPELVSEDLTEWLFSFRDTGPAAYAVAHDRWTRKRSLPWLLMALANGEPTSKGIDEVLAAAAQVSPANPGFETAAFHRARILAVQGKTAEAKALIAACLDQRGGQTTPSSRNLWRALRMPLAETSGAFLADALRIPAGSYGLGGEGAPEASSLATANAGIQATHPAVRKLLKAVPAPAQFIQGDAARILNLRTPTDVLLDLARNPLLPPQLRREWTRAAWVRAVLLERWDLAVAATPDLVALEPELAPVLAGFPQAPPAEREAIALMAFLTHPGFRWMVFLFL